MAPAFANSGTHSPGSQTTSHAGAFDRSVVLTLDRYASRAISSISTRRPVFWAMTGAARFRFSASGLVHTATTISLATAVDHPTSDKAMATVATNSAPPN